MSKVARKIFLEYVVNVSSRGIIGHYRYDCNRQLEMCSYFIPQEEIEAKEMCDPSYIRGLNISLKNVYYVHLIEFAAQI